MINQMSPEVQQVASGSSLARKLLAKAEKIEILVSQPSYHILPLPNSVNIVNSPNSPNSCPGHFPSFAGYCHCKE